MPTTLRRFRRCSTMTLLTAGLIVPQALRAQRAAATSTTASFRGLGLAGDGTIWVSGTGGTVLRSTDGGASWQLRAIADARSFDLRDVEAISASTAYALVAGSDTGRIYKTTDGGKSWVRQYDDTRKGIFLDGFAFWDESHGVAVGDPIDGKFVILYTEDGGVHWAQVPPSDAPTAQRGEAVFAASGTSIAVGPAGRVWIGTGGNLGTGVGRVLRSLDYGRTWHAADTPLLSGTASTGIFSLAFADSLHGIAVGGDYTAPDADRQNVAVTADGGRTWQFGDTDGATGYLSAVAYLAEERSLVAVGSAGVFGSVDGGITWSRLDDGAYNAVVATTMRDAKAAIIAAGDRGRIAVWPSLEAATRKATPRLQRRRPNPD